MKHFTSDYKLKLVEKALSNPASKIKELASQNNVGYSTLTKWIKKYRNGELIKPEKPVQAGNRKFTTKDKIKMLLDTANLDEQKIGYYFRKNGIFSHELNKWQDELMTTPATDKSAQYLKEIKQLKMKNKQFEKELRRKDKALAEASALLILKKKAEMLWGDDEED